MRLTLPNQQKYQQNTQMHSKHIHHTNNNNNNKNKKNNSSFWCTSVAILICLLASGITKTNAVPTDGIGDGAPVGSYLLRRALRDVATIAVGLVQEESPSGNGGIKDAATTESTLDQPQGQCLLDGVLVTETTVYCEKQVGCRAIQKTGHCCPDYKCDCQKDGKVYLNGDKLVDPETPCTVCYCQGGEILCSSVTCFQRDDCTPKFIPGRCCPEYDNCPVSNSDSNPASNKTLSNRQSVVVSKTEANGGAALNPKITIKEITKPIEIRITDDNKAIPIHQMLKPSTTEAPTTTAATIMTTTASATTTAPEASPTTTTTTTTTTPTAAPSPTTTAPTKAESSADNNHKAASLPVGAIVNSNESLKLTASVAYSSAEVHAAHSTHAAVSSTASAAAAAAESSAEDFDEIVMVKNGNGDEKPISVFGTQGLQRVESESVNDPRKVNIKREYLITTEAMPDALDLLDVGAEDALDGSELIYANVEDGVESASPRGSLQQTSAELEPDTAGSHNVYVTVVSTPRTESVLAFQSSTSSTEDSSSSEPQMLFDKSDAMLMESVPLQQSTTDAPEPLQSSTQDWSTAASLDESSTKNLEETMKFLTTEGPGDASSKKPPTTEGLHHLEDEDTAIPVESNPAYPSLPEDDFSLRDVNFPLSETDDIGEADLKDESRSIGTISASVPTSFDAMKSTKHLDDNSYNLMEGSGGGGVMLAMDTPSSTVDNMDASTSSSSTETSVRLPEKVELMYSSEDSSAETSISNSTDFQLEKIMKETEINETGSGESLEVETIESLMMGGSGSGSGELVGFKADRKKSKQREQTTPRPTRRPDAELDIDELGAASGGGMLAGPAEDPKLDVESLKLDENPEDGLAKTDTAATKGNILAVKTNAAQEKTFAETEIVGVAAAVADGGNNDRVQRLFLQRIF